ncbi:MAG TPA: hypothetical protein VGJ86_04510 [Acidimicrobiales bacterium]|jgi:hypothetical protein
MTRIDGIGNTARAVGAVVGRPGLWLTAVRQARLLARAGWWRRPPFLPLPPRDYLRFRLQTAYGGDGRGPMRGDDLVAYLRWCHAWHATIRRR